jgi:hypothetical protein
MALAPGSRLGPYEIVSLVSPDGRWLVYCRSNGGSSLWIVGLGNVDARAAMTQ